jgi:hypothetical protein
VFQGSTLYSYLASDGRDLGQISTAAGIAKFNAVKRAAANSRGSR